LFFRHLARKKCVYKSRNGPKLVAPATNLNAKNAYFLAAF
jgi:hypothetical protein